MQKEFAIYASPDGIPTHAAKLSGLWSSEIGQLEDIEQRLEDLISESYGYVVQFLSRRKRIKS